MTPEEEQGQQSQRKDLILTGWLTCMTMCEIALCGFIASSIRGERIDFLLFLAMGLATVLAVGIGIISAVQTRVVLQRNHKKNK